MSDIVYSIHEPATDIQRRAGQSFGACVSDGYSRDDVIKSATEYYEQQMIDNGETSETEKEVILFILDETGDEAVETEEKITLEIIVEDDGYDGGRFDYLAGIGAIRSF